MVNDSESKKVPESRQRKSKSKQMPKPEIVETMAQSKASLKADLKVGLKVSPRVLNLHLVAPRA